MLYSRLVKSLFRACYGDPPAFADGTPHGLVLVADGCGGLDLCAVGLCHVMGHARVPCAVRAVTWGHGFGRWLADLTDTPNVEARAAQAAHDVQEFLAAHPGAPVYLVGKSGGTAVVVKALELLPAHSVETAVLLSSALSPRYDLTRALRAVRRELVAFWSPLDVMILGLGTLLFGTIDRQHSVSAGLVKFKPPERPTAEQAALYARLRQVHWRPGMAPTGYLGGHVGPDLPRFLRAYVVPLLSTTSAAEMGNSPRCQAGATEGR